MTLVRDDFDGVYRAHAPGAFMRARRLLGNDADAHEVVHDVFLSLIERPEQYDAYGSLTAFLYRAVTHACLNRLRNERNRARLTRAHPAFGPQFEPRDLHAPSRVEHLIVLEDQLRRLPLELAQVAIYHHLDGLTQDEIARLLGCSRRHVGHLLERLKARLGTEERTCHP